MTTEQADHEYQREVFEPTMPPRYVTLEVVGGKESSTHRCGADRARAAFGKHKVPHAVVVAVTQRCYELRAGSKTKLQIAFFENDEKARPKGTLVLAPDRGKVSPTKIELDGSKHEVTVEYTAPDETIRVSIRAFLDGYARGKIHLHLEA